MQYILNVLVSLSLYLLVSTSFAIIYFPTKIFNIAHASVIVSGAYIAYYVYVFLGTPLVIAVFLGVFLASFLGVSFEFFVYSKMRKNGVTGLPYMVAAIGIYVIIKNLISMSFGDGVKILNKSQQVVGYEFYGAYITDVQIAIIVISFLLIVTVNLFMSLSLTGKSIRAVSSNISLCDIYGVSSRRYMLIAFFVGSFLAAIAGILYSMDLNMVPDFGFKLFLYGVVVMIVGGVDSLKGMVFAAVALASVQHWIDLRYDSIWMDLVTFVVLIAFLMFRPLGFSGKPLSKVEV